VKGVEKRNAMWKKIEDREWSGTDRSGMDAEEKGRRKQHSPERQRRSKAVHGQENQKTQQKRK